MTASWDHSTALSDWSDAQVQRRLDATIAYLESDPEWVVGKDVVRMYTAELERRHAVPSQSDPYRECAVYLQHGACACSTGLPVNCTAAAGGES